MTISYLRKSATVPVQHQLKKKAQKKQVIVKLNNEVYLRVEAAEACGKKYLCSRLFKVKNATRNIWTT